MSFARFRFSYGTGLVTALVLLGFLSPLALFAAASSDSLVAYWKFDETSAGTFADSSGSGYVATGIGAGGGNNTPQPTTTLPSAINFTNPRALSFDGTDDYLDLPNGFRSFSGGMTVAVWARPTASSNWARFIDFGNGDANNNILFARGGTTNSLVFEVYDGNTTGGKVYGTGAITNNEWHHYVAAMTSTGQVVIYKDGVRVGLGNTSVPNDVLRTSNFIGESNWAGDAFYTGQMDDLRIYNRALTDAEIGQLAGGEHPTAIWDGSSSTDWETAANWNTGFVPDTYTNIVVPDVTNQPVLTRAASGASLTIESDAFLDLNAYDFELTDGSLKGGGTLRLYGSEELQNASNASTGTVLYYGTGSYAGLGIGDAYYNLTINDGLKGYWKFDEASGSPPADASGYGMDGTLISAPSASTNAAPVNFTNPRSLDFVEASQQYVQLPSSTELPVGASPYTISVWINPDEMDDTQGIIGWGNYGSDEQVNALRLTANGIVNYWWANDLSLTTGDLTGRWHHIAATFNGTTRGIYLDGDLIGSDTPGTPNVGNANARIGATHTDFVEFFDGMIDEVRVYDRALSQNEIGALAAGNMPATASGAFTLGGNLSIANDLAIVSGNLDVSGTNYTITLSGSWMNYGGQFSPQSGTVTFDGTSGTEALLSGGQAFTNLTGAGSGTWELYDDLDVNGTIALNGATLDVTANNYDVHAFDIDQTGGTFTPRSGTVTLDASSSQVSTLTSALSSLNIEDPTEGGLVGYWKFDEGQGSSIVDSSGNGINGTRNGTGAVWTGTVLPSLSFVNQSAMRFNGVSDFMSVANTPFTDSSDEGSISMWVRPDDTSARQVLFWTEANRDRGLSLDGDDSSFAAIMYDGTFGNFRHLSGGTITGNWQHVVFSWNINEGQLRLYVDGALADSFDGPSWTDAGVASPSYIGRYGGDADNSYNTFNPFYAGLMDDVRVYDRALSAAEVTNLANGYYADGDNDTATVTLGGNLDAETVNMFSGKLGGSNRTLDISGDWNNYAGTGSFIAGTSTVDLDGSSTQNVRGSTNFSTFEISTSSAQTVNFGSGTTQGVSTLLTLTGQSSNLLTLAPITAATMWYLDVDGGATQSVSYVSPSYSNASAGAEIDADDGTNTDGGNNTNWRFTAPPSSSSSSSSSSTQPSSSSSGGGGGGSRGSGGPGGAARSPEAIAARQAILDRFLSHLEGIANDGSPGQSSSVISEGTLPSKPLPAVRVTEKRGRIALREDVREIVYRDIPTTAWFTPYVAMLMEEKIAEGYRDDGGKLTGQFGVENHVTYAEVLKMAFKASDEPLHAGSPRNTSAKGTWASSYVAAAEANALPIIDVDLDVHTPATRAEVVRLILDILGLTIAKQPATFSDVPRSHPHTAAIATAAFYGIIEGDTDAEGNRLDTFRPDDNINRAEVSKIIALLREILRAE